MNKGEIIQKSNELKQKSFSDDLVREIRQLLDEIIESVNGGSIKRIDIADVSEVYDFWCVFLIANHISMTKYPAGLLLLLPR